MQSAKELFVHELTDMLDAELKLVDALGQLAGDHSEEAQLKRAFESHQKQTQRQVQRIRQVFELLDEEPEDTECMGMKGLLEEREHFKEEEEPSEDLLSIFDVAASIKVESYEINAYGSLIRLAEQLDLPKAIKLLGQNMKEEEQTKTKLEGMARKLKADNLGLDEESEEELEQKATPRRSPSGSRKGRSRSAA
jgi:ferritin-like metal-binding protein YciE